jgi:hypothetical protein
MNIRMLLELIQRMILLGMKKSIEVLEEVTIENVEDDDGENFEQQFLANKIRGFRRADPSQPAERNTGAGKTVPKPSFSLVTANDDVAKTESKRVPAPPTNTPKHYCHYFNNSGNAHGKLCKFLHSKAPVCSFDAKCNRQKCMFQHTPKSSFLGRSPPPYFTPPPPPPHMSPWTWMFPQMDPNMFQSQWSGQAQNNNWGNQRRN